MTTTYKICLLPGDGIGPEIIAEGVKVLTDKIKAELADTMAMCGVHSLAEISRDMIF